MTYGEFRDVGNERTTLGEGTFRWLVSIRPSHLVYRCGDDYYLDISSGDPFCVYECELETRDHMFLNCEFCTRYMDDG